MSTVSYWESAALPPFPALAADLHVDVVVVGAGMTGITAAYLLKHAGQRVALLERDRCAQQDTGHTTAHLTFVTDLRLPDLVQRTSRDHAQAVWDAGQAAIQQIHEIVHRERLECDFRWAPGYLHAALEGEQNETPELQRDAELANELGFEAELVPVVPVFNRPGVRYPNQAMFHPLKYLGGLVQRIPGDGSHVFERTEAREFKATEKSPGAPGRFCVGANGHTITCDFVVMATDVPLSGLSNLARATLLQAKLAPYTSYAIGAPLPRGFAPQACFWDTSDPYYFLRVHSRPDDDYAIFGGLDHKTGQVSDTRPRFQALEQMLQRFLPQAQVDCRWSGQVIESYDRLPLIGETAAGQFVATGFSGNGITFGTVAGMMACDYVSGRKNPWRELFDPLRTALKSGLWNYLTENKDYPYYMVKDRLAREEATSLQAVAPGQGRLLRLNGRRVAAYRDASGNVTLLSPVCTHLGCIVHWNQAESTWDCPCHGSRFRARGELLAGPAETPLQRVENPV